MLLSDIFDQLAHGELSQLNVGGDNSGVIATSDYPKIITLINTGMTELYTRFDLKFDSLILDLYEHITSYNLQADYAASNTGSSEVYKYINDAGQATPFINNIILITSVFNEAGGEISLNFDEDVNSVFTPAPNVLQVPFPIAGNSLSVVYKASPTKILTTVTDLANEIVPLPNHFLNAIVAYVAQTIFRTLNTPDQNTEAGAFIGIFERAVAVISNKGLVNVDEHLNHRLDDGGWV